MGEIHELFVLALSLVWFAGATPECTTRAWVLFFGGGPSNPDPSPQPTIGIIQTCCENGRMDGPVRGTEGLVRGTQGS